MQCWWYVGKIYIVLLPAWSFHVNNNYASEEGESFGISLIISVEIATFAWNFLKPLQISRGYSQILLFPALLTAGLPTLEVADCWKHGLINSEWLGEDYVNSSMDSSTESQRLIIGEHVQRTQLQNLHLCSVTPMINAVLLTTRPCSVPDTS